MPPRRSWPMSKTFRFTGKSDADFADRSGRAGRGRTSSAASKPQDIPIDRIGSVALNNGSFRINCVANGAKPEDQLTGTLLIPANRMGAIMKSLLDATKELDQKSLASTSSATSAVVARSKA
jgi:hypothetical protein